MIQQHTSNRREFGFKEDHNFVIKDNVLTLKLYDPPSYAFKEVDAELNPHTPLGHELSHMLAGGFYFNEFDPSGAYLWGQKIDDSPDPGRALFFECWVIHGQVISDPNVDPEYKLEHLRKGLPTTVILTKRETFTDANSSTFHSFLNGICNNRKITEVIMDANRVEKINLEIIAKKGEEHVMPSWKNIDTFYVGIMNSDDMSTENLNVSNMPNSALIFRP